MHLAYEQLSTKHNINNNNVYINNSNNHNDRRRSIKPLADLLFQSVKKKRKT